MAEEKKNVKTKRPTAKKRDIQNAKRRLVNRTFKSRVKTAIRSYEKEVSGKNTDGVKAQLNALYSLIDKGVKRGIYKLNKAARMKSRFTEKA